MPFEEQTFNIKISIERASIVGAVRLTDDKLRLLKSDYCAFFLSLSANISYFPGVGSRKPPKIRLIFIEPFASYKLSKLSTYGRGCTR